MLRPSKLLFGTAGTPIASKERSSLAGIAAVKKLGLEAMELEFVRGVRMSEELAKEVRKAAEDNDVLLTAHGPYYINLISKEQDKIKASQKRIFDTARIGAFAGAYSITFHAGFYQGMGKEPAYVLIKREIKDILEKLKQHNINVWVRPETTGKATQFGDYEELTKLSAELDGVMPCIDFAHIHARTNGKYNSYDEICKILGHVEKQLGKQAIQNMHIHMAGIAYGEKGEKNHLELKDSDLKYKEILRALKDFGAKGVVVCESPNIEDDALLMKKAYESL